MAAACGSAHTLLLSEDGAAIFATGSGPQGKLGLGSAEPQPRPVRLRGPAFAGAPVVAVAAGANHSAAVTVDGALWTWGEGAHGQLGLGDREERRAPAQVIGISPSERHVVVMAACGFRHTLVLTAEGAVLSCGAGANGRLGLGTLAHLTTLTRVRLPARCAMVAAGCQHSAALLASGEVFTWGYGGQGALGHNDDGDRLEPECVCGPLRETRVVLLAAAMHTIAVTAAGQLWAWGAGEDGQLGVGDRQNRLVPTRCGREGREEGRTVEGARGQGVTTFRTTAFLLVRAPQKSLCSMSTCTWCVFVCVFVRVYLCVLAKA
jgi:alpha-tubulin suppressor-like RCC1 family protein